MARILTPQDCHVLMNELVHMATGRNDINVVDTSSFVSAGELVLQTGTENTLNAVSLLLGRTFMAVRPYDARLNIINNIDTDGFTGRLRKISFYSRDALASGDWNTQLNGANLKTGATNGEVVNADAGKSATKSMWEQNQPIPLEMNFSGISVWEDSATVYQYQLKQAFRSESEFAQFISGVMTEKANDIETQKEVFNRMTLLNRIGTAYAIKETVPSGAINLTKKFNEKFRTSYTSAELRTTYLEEFLKFFVSEFKIVSDRMVDRSALYHWTADKQIDGVTYKMLRHTPKELQRLILFNPLFTEAEAQVFPTIFNDRYLKIDNYEGVNYWQAIDTPESVKIKCAIPDVTNSNGGLQTVSTEVDLPYVVGCLYDRDALMTQFYLESSAVTPLEARKRFYNTWWTFARNAINDATENFVLFYMEDEA